SALQSPVQVGAGGWLVRCLVQASCSWTRISADSPNPAGGTGSGVCTGGGPLPSAALSGLLRGAPGPCWTQVRVTAKGVALAPQILPGKGKTGQWGRARAPGIWIRRPGWRRSIPMSPGEKPDPLPDPFILQPPVFHPVSVNGQHFLHYRYRLPLSRVDTLGVFGDILVEAVGFLNISPFAEGDIEYPVGYPFLLKSPSLVSDLPPGSPCGGVVLRKHPPPVGNAPSIKVPPS
ncbi:unnamed protein product, partial [Gulo gulo]